MTENRRRLLQFGLFILTIFTTTFAGAEWIWGRFLVWTDVRMSMQDFQDGFAFSIPFLLVLTCHEFGHYFMAKYHNIKVSLPYYIPLWFGFILPSPSLGTMGAFIRIRQHIASRIHYFDVGISGPIAGFVVALGVLWYGFTHLPETEYIYEVHPEYEVFGTDFEHRMEGLDTVISKTSLNSERYNYELFKNHISIGERIGRGDTTYLSGGSLHLGDNLLMMAGRKWLAPDDRYVPSSKELMHYPWLLAGYLALFFTALNLLPIGQLDGGHVIFGLFGPVWHDRIAKVLFVVLVFYAGLGWLHIDQLTDDSVEGMLGFLFNVIVYVYLLYLCSYSLFKERNDRWLFAAIMMAVQFVLASFFGLQGYQGWIVFAILLGRIIGIQHPAVVDNSPLTPGRKVLGWIALVIFILCFTPQPMVVNF